MHIDFRYNKKARAVTVILKQLQQIQEVLSKQKNFKFTRNSDIFMHWVLKVLRYSLFLCYCNVYPYSIPSAKVVDLGSALYLHDQKPYREEPLSYEYKNLHLKLDL